MRTKRNHNLYVFFVAKVLYANATYTNMPRTKRNYIIICTLKYACYPGIFLHEVAHAFVVLLLPNMKITEFHPFSHVKHTGKYTITRSFLISYAPFILNTTISILLLKYVSTYKTQSVTEYLFAFFLIYISGVCMFTAFPSYEDAILPISIMRKQLVTRRILLILMFGPLFLLISIPVIIITYLNRNFYVRIVISTLYIFAVVYLTLINPELITQSFEQISNQISTQLPYSSTYNYT